MSYPFAYLLNKCRHNPQAFAVASKIGADLSAYAARGPLALNVLSAASAQSAAPVFNLVNSAKLHTDDMALHNYLAHYSKYLNLYPNGMARNKGYALPTSWPSNENYIESIVYGLPTAYYALRILILDYGVPDLGHRKHLLGVGSFFGAHREIGTYASRNSSGFLYWAAHTAYRDSVPRLTGCAFDAAGNPTSTDLTIGINNSVYGITTRADGLWSYPCASGDNVYVTGPGGAFSGIFTMTTANVQVDLWAGSGILGTGGIASVNFDKTAAWTAKDLE